MALNSSSQDEIPTEWQFYYDNGGRNFDLWRDVLDTYRQTFNFMVSVGVEDGKKYSLDLAPLSPNEILGRLHRIRVRLEACGYSIRVPQYKDDALSYFKGMLDFLWLIEHPLLIEATAGFNNEAPSGAPILHG